jgi:Zn-dependent protease
VFDLPSIRIGKVLGIPIEVNVSWLAIFLLVAYSLAAGVFPSLPETQGASAIALGVVGVVTSMMFFGSIVLHELSHSMVARATGGHVGRITLFMFGGVAQIEEEPSTAGREFVMAVAGPAASILLAAVLFVAFTGLSMLSAPWWLVAPARYLAGVNLLVGVFNLLPGFPLDGGRVLRSIVWAVTGDLLRATRWASRAGQFLGWAMVFFAVAGVLRGAVELVWFGLIGWFIASLAGQAYRAQEIRSRIEGVTVAQVMSSPPQFVDGNLTLERWAVEHVLGREHSRYPVMVDGVIVGIVSLPQIKRVDRADWPFVRVVDVADTRTRELTAYAEEPVAGIANRLGADTPGMLLVVHDGGLVGVVTRSDVIQLISDNP